MGPPSQPVHMVWRPAHHDGEQAVVQPRHLHRGRKRPRHRGRLGRRGEETEEAVEVVGRGLVASQMERRAVATVGWLGSHCRWP